MLFIGNRYLNISISKFIIMTITFKIIKRFNKIENNNV